MKNNLIVYRAIICAMISFSCILIALEAKLNKDEFGFLVIFFSIFFVVFLKDSIFLFRNRIRKFRGYFYYRKSPRTKRVYVYLANKILGIKKIELISNGNQYAQSWDQLARDEIRVKDGSLIKVTLEDSTEVTFTIKNGKFEEIAFEPSQN